MMTFLFNDINWLLSKKAFSIYSSCMYKPTYENYKMKMNSFISSPFIKIFVCEEKDNKVGILILSQENIVPEIVGIAVSKNYRCHGVGKHKIYTIMRCEHLKIIKAQTDSDSIGFYRKCGFTENKLIVKYKDTLSVRYDCVLQK